MGEAWTRENPVHIRYRPRISLRVDPCLRVAKIGKRPSDRDICKGQRSTHQITVVVGNGPFEIFQDRRKIVELRLASRLFVARPSKEAWSDDQVEEDLDPARNKNGVGKFLEP